ncbi:hypothetical protein M6D93_01325 [Jatrophihabitans telluris]|uniref:NUDIX hydrolase n=1 Tax=Jatrophihabitans telluris TaxID=2038343 RepID=A0ABY4QYN6_9ACTN|nr:hypothetical protein [Jatrophihabitans telluris]UQX88655.1 hypothetical protein M6D93_01325 [Jatrophihabitans telluris]
MGADTEVAAGADEGTRYERQRRRRDVAFTWMATCALSAYPLPDNGKQLRVVVREAASRSDTTDAWPLPGGIGASAPAAHR